MHDQMEENLNTFITYICRRYNDMNIYGYNTGYAWQWGDYWRQFRNEFAKYVSPYRSLAPAEIERCENKLALNESEWRKTGENCTGVHFAEWMKTFIEQVLPPVYLVLVGAYDVHLNPLNGNPDHDATKEWEQPKKRNWLQKLQDLGFKINIHLSL